MFENDQDENIYNSYIINNQQYADNQYICRIVEYWST